MKRMVVILMLICFAMISACQKQDPAVEAELSKRKAELDEREKSLNEREKALGDWGKAMSRFRPNPADLQARKPALDPEQVKAEREKRIQQLPPELQALIRDRSLLNPRAEKPAGTDDRAAELQRRLEEARSRKMNTMTSPNPGTTDTQSISPAPSPTPE